MKGLYKYILVFTLLFSNVAIEAQSFQYVNFYTWGVGGTLTNTNLRSDSDLDEWQSYTGCLTASVSITTPTLSHFPSGYPKYETTGASGGSFGLRLRTNWTSTLGIATMTIDIGKQTDGNLVNLPTRFFINGVNSAGCNITDGTLKFIDRVSVVGYAKNAGANTVNTSITYTPNTMTNLQTGNAINSNTITGSSTVTTGGTAYSSEVNFTTPVCRIVITYFSGSGYPLGCGGTYGSAWPLTSTDPNTQEIWISHIRYTVASCPDLLVLPVELTSFDLKTESNKTVKVFWQTATELNNEKFIVERSENGTDFYSIGEVKGHGTTQEKQDYEFVDAKPKPGILYYRLRQVDYDGKNEVHQTISAEISLDDFIVFPNPAKEYISLSFKNKDALPDKIELMNYTGELIQSDVVKENDIYNFDVKHLAKGIYFIKVFYNQTIQVKNFVIEN